MIPLSIYLRLPHYIPRYIFPLVVFPKQSLIFLDREYTACVGKVTWSSQGDGAHHSHLECDGCKAFPILCSLLLAFGVLSGYNGYPGTFCTSAQKQVPNQKSNRLQKLLDRVDNLQNNHRNDAFFPHLLITYRTLSYPFLNYNATKGG